MNQESNISKNLMRLNAYYNDLRHSNKKWMLLVAIREHLDEVKKVIKGILSINKQGVKTTWLQIKCFFVPSLAFDKKMKYTLDHSEEFSYEIVENYSGKVVAVYTSIFGDYDSLKEPFFSSSFCDYFIVTDQDVPEDSIWKKMDVSHIEGFCEMDAYHKSKFCKMFPHLLFPEYKYSVWVDGNVQIVADILPLVDRLGNAKMATFDNPIHDCIYTEARYNICQGNSKFDETYKQIKHYKEDGFPVKYGMREFSIIVRQHNDFEIQKLMEEWWKQVNLFTMRDQISFPYVLWKNKKEIEYIKSLGNNWRWNPRFILYPHNWHIDYRKKGE